MNCDSPLRMVMKTILAAIVIVLLFSPALAEEKKAPEPVNYNSGEELLLQCKAVEAFRAGKNQNAAIALRAGLCLGVVKGVKDMLIVMNLQQPPVVPVCFPESGVSTDQAYQIVYSYLKSHPEELHKSNTLLTLLALKEAFPCERG